MVTEVLLVLAGHSSSLFPTGNTVHPSFEPLLHPGEQQCLESIGLIASRYRKIKNASSILSRSSSRYVCALASTLNQILKKDYEALVVETEDKDWKPGPLIDMLTLRSSTGIHRIANIMSRLSLAVQRVWKAQLASLLIHGSVSDTDPIVSEEYAFLDGCVPSCVSAQSKSSISYVGKAIGKVKTARWRAQFPQNLAANHARQLDAVPVEDQYAFDRVIAEIRTNVSEWLWMNVLTIRDVETSVDSLANYFLIRNGEFSLSLIREIERLKISRLTSRTGPSIMIREQDLNLSLLRASLGTTAQYDPLLSCLRFQLPSGPVRPLLPSLSDPRILAQSIGGNTTVETTFNDIVLGTALNLLYTVEWPLDMFLQPTDLQVYGTLFAFLSSLRKTHTRMHTCWAALSNAQRARRRWTGLGEGGTREDLAARQALLRCGWGLVREMNWFLDNLLSYVMTDVIDSEFKRLKKQLSPEGESRAQNSEGIGGPATDTPDPKTLGTIEPGTESTTVLATTNLDFTTLQNIHSTYLERLLTGCLLTNPMLTATLRSVFELCEQLVAQVERWGGDVLPALLSEGSLAGGADGIGKMVRERSFVVSEIDETFHSLLDTFYEQLTQSTSQQAIPGRADVSKSGFLNSTMHNVSMYAPGTRTKDGRRSDKIWEMRRHIERLLLRLDFNELFSRPRDTKGGEDIDILRVLKSDSL
ncbi:gamma-tubulin ring complex protein [Multifurca ochricompacta]|uniref:Spindle pole body component n=1 Tax=Multifurca ochricompacta TaxID=376703 RepID=A0AAD4MER8_9AGAM|nr:gamma-tubulin ring complex protein [Multifurca ochricompacta]